MNLTLTRPGSFRRVTTGAAVVLAGLIATTSPALATPIADGTSNTIQFAASSAALDQVHHRVVLTAPVPGGLAPGKRLATAELATPRSTVILTDVLVESVAGSSDSLALNFTSINIGGADAAATTPAGTASARSRTCARAAPTRLAMRR